MRGGWHLDPRLLTRGPVWAASQPPCGAGVPGTRDNVVHLGLGSEEARLAESELSSVCMGLGALFGLGVGR